MESESQVVAIAIQHDLMIVVVAAALSSSEPSCVQW